MNSDPKDAATKTRRRRGENTRQLHKLPDEFQSFAAQAGKMTAQEIRNEFTETAALVTPDSPGWLIDHLWEWAPTIRIARGVNAIQPSRTEILDQLKQVEAAARLLRQSIDDNELRNFLDVEPKSPIAAIHRPLQTLMDDLIARTEGAQRSPDLVTAEGKAKPGRSRAIPSGAVSSQVLCAVVIVEAWHFVRGSYPGDRSEKAWRAAESYWRAIGLSRDSWGSNKFAAWRSYFRRALSAQCKADRDECRRHMVKHAAFANMPSEAGNNDI